MRLNLTMIGIRCHTIQTGQECVCNASGGLAIFVLSPLCEVGSLFGGLGWFGVRGYKFGWGACVWEMSTDEERGTATVILAARFSEHEAEDLSECRVHCINFITL